MRMLLHPCISVGQLKPNPNPNPWMVSRSYATSKDKDDGTSKWKDYNAQFIKKFSKEKRKILRVLLDYDEPHNHLIDGVKVLSSVLEEWKKLRPNFELDYCKVGDLVTPPPILSRLSSYLKVVDEKATTRNKISMAEQTILKLLLDYDDPKFADLVLIEAMLFWKRLVSEVEADCTNVWTIDKDKHDEEEVKCFSWTVVSVIRDYKMVICNYDDDDNSMLKELDARIIKESNEGEKMKRCN